MEGGGWGDCMMAGSGSTSAHSSERAVPKGDVVIAADN